MAKGSRRRGGRGPCEERSRISPLRHPRYARGTMPAATQSRSLRRPLLRLAWAVVIAILVVLLLPYLLVPLYRVVNPVSTPMLWRWATGARVEHSLVPLERMAPVLPVTVIASEDGRFCSHHGIDWPELRERLEDADDISEARGVSTITQQT